MFFVFSKILSFLAQPVAIIVILLVAGWIIKNQRWKKILTRTGFILLLLTSNFFIANELMRAWETPVTTFESIKKQYDYGILLTGVTKTNMKPKDRVYFNRGADRATHTLQLYKLGIIKKVIISGGSGRLDGSGVREADDLADFLKLAGIPSEDLIIENESKNTHESARYVSAILSKLDGPKECLVITSAYHLPRAMACFRKAGVKADAFAAEPTADERRFNPDALFVPKLEAMAIWQTLLKEWVGFIAYWFAGYI
jgi:uncharacterized SAM-binding protein YcdF (DUF218 family)